MSELITAGGEWINAVSQELSDSITVSTHAKERVMERFHLQSKTKAKEWIENNIGDAEFLTVGLTDDGNNSRIFAKGDIFFALDLYSDHVVTVYKEDGRSKRDALRSISSVLEREMRKHKRETKRKLKELDVLYAEIQMEMGEVRLNLAQCRSKAKQTAYLARYNALSERMSEVTEETTQVRNEHTRIMRGFAAML